MGLLDLFRRRPPAPEKDATPRPTVLLIADDPEVLTALRDALADGELELLAARGSAEALGALERAEVDAIVVTQRLEEGSGVDFLDHARRRRPQAGRIVISTYADMKDVVPAIQQGTVHRCLLDPWRAVELKATVTQSVKRDRTTTAASRRPSRDASRRIRRSSAQAG